MMDKDRQIALEWARKHYEQASDAEKWHWEFVFPELKESEDERIRREIIDFICWEIDRGSVTKEQQEKSNSWLAYLEKQKEQKPADAEWSEEDEAALGDLMWCIKQARKSAKDENDMGNIWFTENWVKNRLKSLRPKPKQEWNEEDKNKIESIKGLITTGKFVDTDTIRIIWKLLDSLRPQLHWKPSKEQMEALKSYAEDSACLDELYNDLKKL